MWCGVVVEISLSMPYKVYMKKICKEEGAESVVIAVARVMTPTKDTTYQTCAHTSPALPAQATQSTHFQHPPTRRFFSYILCKAWMMRSQYLPHTMHY